MSSLPISTASKEWKQLSEIVKKLQEDLEAERKDKQKLREEVVQLKKDLENEANQRVRITNWIRDNIGANLEHVMQKVAQQNNSNNNNSIPNNNNPNSTSNNNKIPVGGEG